MNENSTEGQKTLTTAETLVQLKTSMSQIVTPSANVISTQFSNTTSLAALVTAVNNHLANSSKKFISVQYFTSNILTVVYMAVVTERIA